MQKKIIALAIAAAFSAPAFADTSVYGIVDGAVAQVAASGTKSNMLAFSGGLATSRIGVNSSEDLGNGMKAVVNIEYGLDTETNQQAAPAITVAPAGTLPAGATVTSSAASNLAARQQMLAIAGGFGTVATGYLQTTGYDFGKSFDPTAGSLVSPLGNVTKGKFLIGIVANLARAPRALAYISPDMSGFTVALNYSTEASGGTGTLGVTDASGAEKATAYLVSANYKAGALAASVVLANMTNAKTDTAGVIAGGAKLSETAIGASYDFGVAKLSATYQTFKDDSAVSGDSNTAMSVSGVIPAGPGAVALSYAKATNKGNVTAAQALAGTTDLDASGYTVAWLQGLSKTTTFYAAYTSMSQGSNTKSYSVANNAIGGAAGLANGTGSTMLAVGLSKKF